MSISRFFRALFSLFLLLLGLAIVVPIAAYFFFDPNHFKSEITSFISSKTGLPLEIHGKIKVQAFPWVGLNVHQVDLVQPSQFGQGKMIEVNEMGLKMSLEDLLHKKFNIESLVVDGLTISAIKNKDGSTNWEYYSKQVKNKQDNPTESQDTKAVKTKTDTQAKKLNFALLQFALKNAKVSYEDRQTGQTLLLEKFDLQGQQGASPSQFPIEGAIQLQVKDKDPMLSFKTQGKFEGLLQQAKQGLLADLKVDFSLDMPNNPEKFRHTMLSSNIKADFSKSIAFNDVSIKSGPIDLNGLFTVPMDKQQAITFKLNINQVDLQALQGFTAKSSAEATTHSAPTIVPVKEVKTTKQQSSQPLSGEVTIGKVLAHGVVLEKVNTKIKKDGSTLQLRDLTANLYQGKLQTNVTKNLQNPQAPVALQGKLSHIQLAPLLRDLKQETRISGVSNLDFNLTHHENNGLNGTLKLQMNDGVIEGIDVKYYLSLAQSLLKKVDNKETDNKRTPFGSLQATLLFNNNVMDNNDLLITSNDFTAKGEGSINLNSQTIAYKIQALKTYQDGKEHKNAYPLAIRIKGALSSPKVEPDYDVYLKKLMQQEMKGELNKQIGKLLGAPKEGEATDSPESSQNLEDAAKKKLEDKIEKGLKKLFR